MNMDPNAYLSNPPALIRAAKNNAYYIGRLTQHLSEFDKDLAEWKSSGEWKKDYKSWGAACDVALGITKQWADKLIKRYNATESPKAETTVSTSPLSNKAAVLATVNDLPDPLAELEAQLAKAVVQAGATEPEPDAAQEPPGPPKDCMGYPIPQRCLVLWNQRDEVQEYLTAASRLKCLMDELQDGCKGVYVALAGNVQTHMISIKTIYYHLSKCKPWAVCPICDGSGQSAVLLNPKKRQPCILCCQTGLVAEKVYSGDWRTGHSETEREAIFSERESKCSN